MSPRRLALDLAILALLGGCLAVLVWVSGWSSRRPAQVPPAPAAPRAPAVAPRLRGYLSPAPPQAPAKLVVYVTDSAGVERGFLFRGEFRPSAANPAVLMFSGPAEALAVVPVPPDLPPSPGPGDPAGELLAATNRVRLAAGLGVLKDDPRLDAAARGWAERCAERGKLDHFEGASTPWTRIKAEGVICRSASENAAWGQDTATRAVTDWAGERPPGITGHRDNLLNPAFTHAGGGAAQGKDGRWFYVADYAQE